VAARVGGLRESVVHGETGLLFERGDAEELAAALARLLDDAALRTRMGEAGRARVEAMYTWPRIIEQHYPAILARLCGNREEDDAA
jgi:glycosyltransferase involved in cell wall biosynthesis